MIALTREEVVSVVGPVDETTIAEVVATQATLKELSEAWAWVNADEALLNQGRPLPTGRAAALIEILSDDDDEETRS
jgi:hypothetical protein